MDGFGDGHQMYNGRGSGGGMTFGGGGRGGGGHKQSFVREDDEAAEAWWSYGLPEDIKAKGTTWPKTTGDGEGGKPGKG